MSSVIIEGTAHPSPNGSYYRFSTTRQRILELFPDSLLASALQLDSTAEVITLSHPDVTLNSLIILEYILRTEQLPNVLSRPEYERAGPHFG